MRSTLKAGIIEAVQQCPGIGVADLAARLGADKGNVRRFALELERDDKLVARKDADGYRFFPVGFAMPDRKNAVDHYQPQVIDAEFRVIDPVRTSHSGGGPVIHRLPNPTRRVRGVHPSVQAAWTPAPDGAAFDFGAVDDHEDDSSDDWSPPSAPAPVIPRQPSRALVVAPKRPPEPPMLELVLRTAMWAFEAWQGLARQQQEHRAATARAPKSFTKSSDDDGSMDRFAQRQRERAEVEEAARVRADPVRQMLARAKAARPEPSPAEDRSWWKRIFAGAPSKAVWK